MTGIQEPAAQGSGPRGQSGLAVVVIGPALDKAEAVTRYLTSPGKPCNVVHFMDVDQALPTLTAALCEIVFLDLSFSTDGDAVEVLQVCASSPRSAVIALTPPGHDSLGLKAIANGAQDFMPINTITPDTLRRSVTKSVARHRMFIMTRQHESLRMNKVATDLQATNTWLGEHLTKDTLAGVLNRRGLEGALATELERVRRLGTSLAATLIFTDNVRTVVDGYGRAYGDALLVAVATALQAECRPCDYVGRVTDDTFLVLLPDTRLAEARVAAERLRAGVARNAIEVSDGRLTGKVRPEISFGVTIVSNHNVSLKEIFSDCKEALRAGRPDMAGLMGNHAPVPGAGDSSVMPSISLSEKPITESLRVVPLRIMRLEDQELAGYEFLIRGPPGPLENPIALFNAAGTGKALAELDLRCLSLAVGALQSCPDRLRYHFNLFPSTLQQVDVAELVAMMKSMNKPATLCIEISEQRLVGDPALLAGPLRALRDAGIEVAIDDVGFGRSSLEVLLVTEPQIVKVDRVYIDGVAADSERRRLLRRFIGLVHGIGAVAIAEGIEKQEDLVAVKEMGIALGQGWLWGKPGERRRNISKA